MQFKLGPNLSRIKDILLDLQKNVNYVILRLNIILLHNTIPFIAMLRSKSNDIHNIFVSQSLILFQRM